MQKACRIIFCFFLAGVLCAEPASISRPEMPQALRQPAFRVECVPVPGGAELLTVFGPGNGTDVPLFSVLRDTLGNDDPETDILRYVWTFTSAPPTVKQRLAAMLPFYYRRGGGKAGAPGWPDPLLGLAQRDNRFWNEVFELSMQWRMLDPQGVAVRAPARSYRGNASDLRRLQTAQVLAVLARLEAEPDAAGVLTRNELRQLKARLALSNGLFGSFVDDPHLDQIAAKMRAQSQKDIGRNWDILHQSAEAEGLWFEPLALDDESPLHAIVWIRRDDLEDRAVRPRRKFDKKFLRIRDPWTDPRLRDWNGYVETRYFDLENRRAAADDSGASAYDMIPLALYALDHPRVPLLLADLRNGFGPKKREVAGRLRHDIARNILGWHYFGNWSYFGTLKMWEFIRGRTGVPVNPTSRLRAYSQVKLFLELDDSLEPELREQLGGRLARVSVNPMENSASDKRRLAHAQYRALLEWARDPDGLQKRLTRDRRQELVASSHGRLAKFLFKTAHIGSLGIYTHREKHSPAVIDDLDTQRRIALHRRLLEEAVASPQPEVVWKTEELRRSVGFLAQHDLWKPNGGVNLSSWRLIERLMTKTRDRETRWQCYLALAGSPYEQIAAGGPSISETERSLP